MMKHMTHNMGYILRTMLAVAGAIFVLFFVSSLVFGAEIRIDSKSQEIRPEVKTKKKKKKLSGKTKL